MHHPQGFPSRLVRLRADAGMTQRDLAKVSGVSLPQIGRYETGTSKPRMTAIVKLAKALNVSTEELLDSDSEPEMFELTIETPSKTFPLAMPSQHIEWLQMEADKHGVTLEVLIGSIFRREQSRHLGSEITIEEAIAQTSESLKSWPSPAKPKE